MKAEQLTVEQIMKFKGAIDAGVSAPTFPIKQKDGSVINFTARATTEYVCAFLTDVAGNNGELLINGNKAIPGLRSINDTMLAANVTQLVYEGRILADKTLVATSDAAIKVAEFASVAPANVKNGEFKITQGQVLLRTTGTDIHNAKAATSNDDDFKAFVPFVFRPQLPISINLVQSAAPTANHAIKFEYRCIEIVPATNA